jgi:alginate O-acetyltransferase complex protein AlgI
MLFDTPVYFVFLALVALAYWRLRWRAQNVLLLAASYFFYGWWDWRFLLLMIGSTAIDYVIAREIEDASYPAKRRALLIASLVVNFTILGFFKYFNFFLNSSALALDALGFHNVPRSFLAIILPPAFLFIRSRRWPTSSMSMPEGSRPRGGSWTMVCSSACSRI